MKKSKNNAPTATSGGSKLNSDKNRLKGAESKLKGDIIFISLLLGLLLAVGAAVTLTAVEGDLVEVYIDGMLSNSYSLGEDLTVDISGVGGVNRLRVKGGEATIEYADCPDGICESHRPISRSGESIVCLPHKVVVTVKSAKGANAPDVDAAA